MSLGVKQHLLAHLVWELLIGDAWRVGGPQSSLVELGVARMRAELFAFYKSEEKAGRSHCRVQQLLPSFFGDKDDPACKLHAAETNGFLAFATSMLAGTRGQVLGPRATHYRVAAKALLRIKDIIQAHPRKVPDAEKLEFVNQVKSLLDAEESLGLAFKPKHHFLIEMAARLPLYYSVV